MEELTYSLTIDDVRERIEDEVRRTRRSRRFVVAAGGAALAVGVSLALGLLANPRWLCVTVPVAGYAALAAAVYATARRNLAVSLPLLVPHDNEFRLTSAEDGLVVRSAHSVSTYRWSAFTAGASHETASLFVLAGNEELLVVPKRAFAGAEDLAAFRSLVARRVGASAAPARP